MVTMMTRAVAASRNAGDTLRGALMVTPSALAALERQADREEMTLNELVGSLLEKAASRFLIEESTLSIRLGEPYDDDLLLVEKGFDLGGGDA